MHYHNFSSNIVAILIIFCSISGYSHLKFLTRKSDNSSTHGTLEILTLQNILALLFSVKYGHITLILVPVVHQQEQCPHHWHGYTVVWHVNHKLPRTQSKIKLFQVLFLNQFVCNLYLCMQYFLVHMNFLFIFCNLSSVFFRSIVKKCC